MNKVLKTILILLFSTNISYAQELNNQESIIINQEKIKLYQKIAQENDYYNLATFLFDLATNKLEKAKKEKSDISKAIFIFTLSGICLEKSNDILVNDFWQISNLGYIKTKTSWERDRKYLLKIDRNKLEEKLFDSMEEQYLILNLNNKFSLTNNLGLFKSGEQKKFPKEKLEIFKKVLLTNENINFSDFDKIYFNNINKIVKKKIEEEENNKKLILIKIEEDKKKKELFFKNEEEKKKKILEEKIAKENKRKLDLINLEKEKNQAELNKNNTKKQENINFNKIELKNNQEINDFEVGKIAWKYFEKSYQNKTGFFDSALYYNKTTMWDVGSSLAGIISANKLGIIDNNKANFYLDKIIKTLENIKLYNNELPNREYNTFSGNITSEGIDSIKGSGWSALDLGRLLIWLKITQNWYPNHKNNIGKLVSKWKFERLTKNGYMNGTILDKTETLRQEGRLGYEQYSGAAFYKWNILVPNALDYDKTKKVKIGDIELYLDKRNLAYFTSEPFFLAKMELGKIDNNYDYLTEKIYELQKKRFEKYKQLTAVTEDAYDQYPWFVYNSVYFENKSWVCTSPSGKEFNNLKTISSKASFAWDAIFNDSYSKLLKEKVLKNFSNYGYYSGIYEKNNNINKSININTNAVILESLLYKKLGKKSFIDYRF